MVRRTDNSTATAAGRFLPGGARCARRHFPIVGWFVFVAFLLTGRVTRAQDLPHLNFIQPGGMPGLPTMMGAAHVTNGVNITWDGPSGYYQLYQKGTVKGGTWQAIGGFNLSNNATITAVTSNAFFRVLGPTPHYTGAANCQECHQGIHDTVVLTPHAGAFSSATFIAQGGQTNQSCLPCHTVGAGLPSGFTSLAATPQLAGVQCESCHGPAGLHAANPANPTTIPRVELAAQVCGGCHNLQFVPASAAQFHEPLFEDWNSSPHQSVLPELQSLFTSAQATNYLASCGQCHSGTVREALLDNTTLPDGHEASAIGIACATCHEPHSLVVHTNALNGVFTNLSGFIFTNNQLGAVYTNQLRNPLASLTDYTITTTNAFTNQYNPNINVCAQCHNDRGANWADSTRPPHESPQYNMLLGTIGLTQSGLLPNQPGTHALIEQQCTGCHMQTSAYVSPAQPAVSGHQFEVTTYQACANCHGSAADGQALATFLTADVSMEIQLVTAELQLWATTKAPAALAPYGSSAWEYTAPGDLSTIAAGPTAAQQLLIPNNIKMARFNLYLVQNDGSFGVHNPDFAISLLLNASQWVQQQLAQ